MMEPKDNDSVLQTSANMLLDNSYLSILNTQENGTIGEDNFGLISRNKRNIDYNKILRCRPGTLISNQPLYFGQVAEKE